MAYVNNLFPFLHKKKPRFLDFYPAHPFLSFHAPKHNVINLYQSLQNYININTFNLT